MKINQKDWIRRNKRAIINEIVVDSGAKPDRHMSAIFMAGLPGAGKTEFTKNLVDYADAKFVRLDMDEIAERIEGYKPQKADQYREAATLVLNEAFSEVLKRKLDFIMDGTFSSRYASLNIERTKKHGFGIRIIYIYQDPKIAWQYTLAREKVEHRAIQIDGFISAYFNTISNIKEIIKQNHGIISLDFVEKNPENKVIEWRQNIDLDEFDKVVNNNYTKESLKEYVDD